MASPEQVVQQIRFGLETLRERNGHHEFEALCFALARRRIVSNLLPATGPVSSGGDQGRDAESHWTNLPNEIGAESAFTALATADNVVLACTMQQTAIPGKIRKDIASIVDSPLTVQRIIYFTVTPVDVANRHKLQGEAKKDHDVVLDIWDAQAIAQHLSDADLFYLAVQYLHVPSELAPPAPKSEHALPAWYLTSRTRWRNRTDPVDSFGEFMDLRSPLRYATFHGNARGDLAEWLSHARDMLAVVHDPKVKIRCRYEIAVATLRGTNTLRPADDLVREFFTEVLQGDADPSLLEDAVVLGQYCASALSRGITDLSVDEVTGWQSELSAKVRRLLEAKPYPNTEAHLLALAARLSLQPAISGEMQPGIDELETPQEITERVLELLDSDELPELDLAEVELVDLDGGMAYLESLCRALPGAPMFPVEHIADYFDLLATRLVDHPSYLHLRDELDTAVARVQGEAAKADRSRNRGMRFLAANRLLDALKEIHNAKINWWHGETLEGAILALLLASHIYSRLNLYLAAKQHALVAAGVARSSRQTDLAIFIARGFVMAAGYDYGAGSWLTATQMMRVAAQAQGQYAEEPWDFERHPEFCTMVTYQAMILRAARSLRPAYAEQIDKVLRSTGLDNLVQPILDGVEELPEWSEQGWADAAGEGGHGQPFGDAGPSRSYTWSALGISWTVSAANERRAVLAAERFCAAVQIVLAELATDDALLLRGEMYVEVRPDASALTGRKSRAEYVPDNDASRWVVHLSPVDEIDIENVHQELAAVLVQILATNSLLPQQTFLQVMTRAFERGLWHKLAMGRPYDENADLIDTSAYDDMASLRPEPLAGPVTSSPLTAAELRPSSLPGPGYDKQASLTTVQARYENMIPMLRYTLPRVVKDPAFMQVVTKLRSEGWLDWHLLQAMANYIGNRRLEWDRIPFPPRTEAQARRAMKVMQRNELPNDPKLPASDFSEELMRQYLQMSVPSTVKVLGLQCHQKTPDFDAIFELLGARYAYWSEDIEHDDMFG